MNGDQLRVLRELVTAFVAQETPQELEFCARTGTPYLKVFGTLHGARRALEFSFSNPASVTLEGQAADDEGLCSFDAREPDELFRAVVWGVFFLTKTREERVAEWPAYSDGLRGGRYASTDLWKAAHGSEAGLRDTARIALLDEKTARGAR